MDIAATGARQHDSDVRARCVVGIITRDRPDELRSCLKALRPQVDEHDEHAQIIVVDNGDAWCGVTSDTSTTVLTSEPGYTIARNRVLAASTCAEFLIFLDDDQRVRPGWLAGMLRAAEEHPGAIVTGYRRLQLPHHLADPALRDAIASINVPPTRGPVSDAATGNTLIPIAAWRDAGGPRFQSAFAGFGGEDTDFFQRLREAGVPLWCEPSLAVDEPIVPARLTRRWLVQRVFNSGRARATIRILRRPLLGRAMAIAGGLGRIGAGAASGIVTSVRRRRCWPQDWYRFVSGVAFIRQSFARLSRDDAP